MIWLKRTVLVVLFLASLLLGAVELCRHYLDPDQYRDRIASFVEEEYGLRLKVSALRVTPFPVFDLVADKVRLEGDGIALTAGSLAFDIALESLPTGRIDIAGITVMNPAITVERRPGGQWNFQDIRQPSVGNGVVRARLKKISLVDGNLLIVDRASGGDPLQYLLSNVNFAFDAGTLIAPPSVALSARLKGKESPAKLRLLLFGKALSPRPDWRDYPLEGSLSLTTVSPGDFARYVKKFVPERYFAKSFSLEYQFSGVPSRKVLFDGGIFIKPGGYGRVPALRSGEPSDMQRLETRGRVEPERLVLDYLSLHLPEITLRGKTTIERYGDTDPFIRMSVDTPKVNIGKVGALVPPAWSEEPIVRFVRENVSKGKFQLAGLNLAGRLSRLSRLDDPDNLDLASGRIKIEDVQLRFAHSRQPIDDVNGTLQIEQGRIGFFGINARYGKNRLENVKGAITNLRETPLLNASFDANLDLDEFHRELMTSISSPRLSEILGAATDFSGGVACSLNVSTELSKPESLDYHGIVTLNDIGFRHGMFDLPVEHLKGRIRLDRRDLDMEKIVWTTGSSRFEMLGRIDRYTSRDYRFDLTFDVNGAPSEFAKSSFYHFPFIEEIEGVAHTRLDIEGTLDAMDFTHMVDFTLAGYTFKSLLKKRIGTPSVWNLKGRYYDGHSLTIDEGRVLLASSNVLVAGRTDHVNTFDDFELDLRLDRLDLSDLPVFVPSFSSGDATGSVTGDVRLERKEGRLGYRYGLDVGIERLDLAALAAFDKPMNFKKIKPVGVASGTLRVEGETGSLPSVTGNIDTENFGFNTKLNRPLHDLNGVAVFGGNTLQFDDVPAGIGGSAGKISGKLEMLEKPIFSITAEMEDLDFEDLFDLNRKKDEEEEKHDDIKFDWDVFIRSKKGNLRYIDYTDLVVSYGYYKDQFDFSDFTFVSNGGKWKAKGDLNTEGDNRQFDGAVSVDGLNLSTFIPRVWPKMDKINGSLFASGSFRGDGFKWDRLRKNISGEMTFVAKDGSLEKYKGLGEILRIVNLAPVRHDATTLNRYAGIPYDTITGNMTIQNGLGRTNDLTLEGDVMRMSAVGDVDLKQATVDFTVCVKPFTTVDKVLSSIPLAGKILTGEGKSLVVTYYDVKGPMADPVAQSVPVQSISETVFGLFRRILEIPSKAISNKNEVPKKEESKAPASAP